MKVIYIRFTYTVFRLMFENDLFADNFKTVFQAISSKIEQFDNTIDVKGDDKTKYSIYFNNSLIEKDVSRNEATHCITNILGQEICSHKYNSICIMHASSVLLNNKIVSFSGISGSGKTTLSLLFSKYGNYIGDEYAFLNINTGSLWHEQHPFRLKESNKEVINKIDDSLKIAEDGEPFGRAYYISLNATNYVKIEQKNNIKLKICVFPHFNKNFNATTINILPVAKLPIVILQSLMGQGTPSMLFGRFTKLATLERIQFIEVNYSDGVDASAKLFEYIKNR